MTTTKQTIYFTMVHHPIKGRIRLRPNVPPRMM